MQRAPEGRQALFQRTEERATPPVRGFPALAPLRCPRRIHPYGSGLAGDEKCDGMLAAGSGFTMR